MKGKKPYSKGSCRKVRRNPAPQPDGRIASELILFFENDEFLLARRYPQFILNLERKMKRGVYDREKAIKLFMYLADEISKKYSKDFGDGKTHAADVPTRMLLAKMLRDRFESERRAMGIPETEMADLEEPRGIIRGKRVIRRNPVMFVRTKADLEKLRNLINTRNVSLQEISYTRNGYRVLFKELQPYEKEVMGESFNEFAARAFPKVVNKNPSCGINMNPVAPSGYHYMPDGRLMADSAHSVSKNPFSRESDRIKGYDDDIFDIEDKPLFKSGGYAVVITFKSGEVEIGQGMSQTQAERQRKYLMKEYARLKLMRGTDNVSTIEVLPVTSVTKNPPLSSHGSSIRIKRTHGLSLAQMRALYKLVKQGNDMAIAYARKKLEVPRSASKSDLLAVVDHHIRDLADR